MLFQLVLTKFFKSELFSCLPKVGHVIKSCKEPFGFPYTYPLCRDLSGGHCYPAFEQRGPSVRRN